jgi:hypothetical protein
VSTLLPVVMLGLAGFLIGGAYSMQRQGRPTPVVVVMVVAGVMCGVVGALYL